MNINKILDNKWIVKLLNLGAIALFIDYFITPLFKPSMLTGNILMWKILPNGEHHFLDYIGIILMFFALLPIFYKNPKTKKVFGVIAFFMAFSLISLHEVYWYICFMLSRIISHIGFNPIQVISSEFFLVGIIAISAMILLSNKGAWTIPKRTILVLSIYYLFWLSLGFPLTIDYLGNTVYYHNLDVNIIEVVSWIIPIFVFPAEQLKYITAMVNESKPKGESFLTTTDLHPLSGG